MTVLPKKILMSIVAWIISLVNMLRKRIFFIRNDIHVAYGTYIHKATTIGRRTRINAPSHLGKCTIGSYCAIGGRLIVRSGNHHTGFLNMQDYAQRHFIYSKLSVIGVDKGGVSIGNGVWIGDSVIILPGVNVGNGAVIGAGSVVTKSVPEYAIVVGNPARVVRLRFPTDIVELLKGVDWWNWSDEKLQINKWLFESDLSKVDESEISLKLALLK